MTLLIGALLGLCGLDTGFFTDDYPFIARLEDPREPPSSVWRLYEFASGDVQVTSGLVRHGPFPWWTAPDLKLRFLRPLSSALFALDHELFGQEALGYHVHAFIWYVALLTCVALLYRSALSRSVLGMSSLVYMIAGSHAEPAAWLSSRHMLVSATPALLGLWVHVRKRERGEGPSWFAPLGLAAGLVASEAALATTMYWFGYELFGAPEDQLATRVAWQARVRRIAVPLAIMMSYLAIYKALGYGVAHCGAYVDPLASPLAFVVSMLQRVPLLLGEMFVGIPSSLGNLLFPTAGAVIGVVATAGVLLLLRMVWSDLDESDRRALRWLGAGSLGSLVVGSGGIPGSRLLLIPGIGGAVILGTILAKGWARFALGSWPVKAMGRAAIALLALLHIVLAPLAFIGQTRTVRAMGAKTAEIDASLDELFRDRKARSHKPLRVFVLVASDPLAGLYVAAVRAMRAPGMLSAWNLVSMARATHTIERTSNETLVLKANPPMLRGVFENVFRAEGVPFHPGDRVILDDAVVTVQTTENGHPTTIELRFQGVSMDDPSVCILAWNQGKLAPLHVAPNEVVTLPWSAGPTQAF